MTAMDEDRDELAAEYVLGTLDADERAQAEALLLIDPAFAETVQRWERRLGELNVLVAPVEPPPQVWDRIKEKLAETAPSDTVVLPEVTPPVVVAPAAEVPAAAAADNVFDLKQRVSRWRGLTALTTLAAACVVGLVLAREYRPDALPKGWQPKPRIVEVTKEVVREVVREVPAPQPTQFVAVFTKSDETPAFVMSFDTQKRTVTVRRVTAEEKADRVYQLWIATEPGAAPRSLGVLDPTESVVQAALQPFDTAVVSNATFGISEEPTGGSERPTGPVIHARLVTPPQAP